MKTFLVINLSYFGDVLLTNALCQDIKEEFPDSKVVFLVNKPFYEAAKYQKDVDEVICFDKSGKHKGFWGLLRFIFTCKYRNKIDTAFIMYANDRGALISYGLRAKNRISASERISKIFLTQKNLMTAKTIHTQDSNAAFLSAITGRIKDSKAIKFEPDEKAQTFAEELLSPHQGQEIVGLCLTSKRFGKDMPIQDAAKIIEQLHSQGKVILFTGTGEVAIKYVQDLKDLGCEYFVDLVDKTSIVQLGAVIQKCNYFISVDTGSMHLACAVATPLVSLFYDYDAHHLAKWQPREDLYNCKALLNDITPESIFEAMSNLK